MNPLRYPICLVLVTLLLPALAMTGCDSATEDDGPAPSGFNGDARLLGMWVGPPGDGYQYHVYYEHDASAEVLRVSDWEHNMTAGCFMPEDTWAIPLSEVTTTTLGSGGDLINYTISGNGSTLTIAYPDYTEQYTRSSRTPVSMAPTCP